jgi:hypothetical protein
MFAVDMIPWLPRDAQTGLAIIHYNTAVIHAMANDIEKAFGYFHSVGRLP